MKKFDTSEFAWEMLGMSEIGGYIFWMFLDFLRINKADCFIDCEPAEFFRCPIVRLKYKVWLSECFNRSDEHELGKIQTAKFAVLVSKESDFGMQITTYEGLEINN